MIAKIIFEAHKTSASSTPPSASFSSPSPRSVQSSCPATSCAETHRSRHFISAGGAGFLAGAVRNAIRAVNPEAVPTPRTMEAVLAGSLARQRFQMEILATFAVLALLLAVVGLYGVLSYMVTANRAQIGIRLALDAQPALVFRMVTGRALAPRANMCRTAAADHQAMHSAYPGAYRRDR
jgi:hypothetical protein